MTKVFEIRDSEATQVDGFDLDWLPPWAYDHVTPKASRDGRRLELEAGPFVGSIPLIGNRLLYVVPRAGRQSFSRMLLVTEGLKDAIRDEIDDLAGIGIGEGGDSWIKLLSRSFMRRLQEIEKESLAPERVIQQEYRSYVRGRISVVPTLKAISRREAQPVLCHYRVKTFNTPENRVLSAAADQLLKLGVVRSEHRQVAIRWARRLEIQSLRKSELQRIVIGLSTKRYAGFRPYYVPALLMARLILSQAGTAFAQEDIVESESFLTNMPILFERYVRHIMTHDLSQRGYIVRKLEGGSEARHLFLDGTCEMLPDILVSNANGVQLIADAKYKPAGNLSSSDYYQMVAYLNAYDCTTGLLIRAIEGSTGDLKEPDQHRTRSGKQVFEVQLPLNSPEEAEAMLSEVVLRVVS